MDLSYIWKVQEEGGSVLNVLHIYDEIRCAVQASSILEQEADQSSEVKVHSFGRW